MCDAYKSGNALEVERGKERELGGADSANAPPAAEKTVASVDSRICPMVEAINDLFCRCILVHLSLSIYIFFMKTIETQKS